MRRLTTLITLIVLLVGLVPLSTPALAGASDAPIRLKAATFRPGLGERPNIPPGLTTAEPASGAYGYYLVQFAGPVQAAWTDALTAAGAEILAYVPDFAFKVRMTRGVASQVRRLEGVAWTGLFHPAYKLSPDLAREGAGLYRVRVERGAEAGRVTAAIARSGAQVLAQDGDFLLVGADGARLEAIARVLDVAWIEDYVLKEKHNEYGAGVILGANVANASGYDGSTQIAAVSDTGLGDGTPAGAHPDIPSSRIVNIYNLPGQTDTCFRTIVDDGPQDVDSGHGTHTAVSVLGDGGDSGEGKGVAPAANLVFQATENYAYISRVCQRLGGWPAEGYFLTGLPADLRTMYQQAYNAGARIHSNSWGAALVGEYTLDSANTDDFVWNNPDMTITFSSGNEGTDANADGVVDNDSTGSPGTAKNVITVGASENDRQGNYQCDTSLTYTSYDLYQTGQTCDSMDGNQVDYLGTWGQRYPADFPAEPLATDVTAGNAEQMASWSSRGPTDDGRIKPDVVAPGTWVLSGFSGLYQEGYGDPVNPQNGLYQWDGWGMPRNEFYKHMGGTSMANPIAAGAATVVRDFYQKAYGHSASAALVKATLINSAVDLLDENNDGADDNDYPIPNVHEGWGRVNLANATDGSHQFVDEATGLNSGGSAAYPFNVATAGQPFKVSLVWSDYPSTEAATQNLVNDLDLLVTAPGGAQYRGNVFSGGWSQTGGSADRTNNVENVYVQSAAAGTWTVQVSGYNVPNGPQPYALVVDGTFGQVDNPPVVSIVNPAEDSTVSGIVPVQISATDDNDPSGTLTVEWNVGGGAWQPASYNSGNGYYEASWDTTQVSEGGHTVNARATDSASNVGTDSNNVTVDNINDPPVATFTYNCTGLSCDFDASGSYDPDGTIVSYDWDFGDTETGSGVTTSHTYAAADTYTVVLTVTDDDDATDTDSQDVTVDDTVPTMFVFAIDMSGKAAGPNRSATAVVTIKDTDGNLVEGATVYGNWSGDYNASVSNLTLADGTATFNSGKVRQANATFTFTADDVVKSGYTYDPELNIETSDTIVVP
jgi:serine protease AprX